MNRSLFSDIKEFSRIELIGECLNTFGSICPYSNKFYIFFIARDSNYNSVMLEEKDIIYAVQNKKIRLVHYLTGDEYTLGIVLENPQGDMFTLTNFFRKKEVNVMEIVAGKFSGYAPISVVFDLSNEIIISTEFMSFSGFECRALVYQK
ncbi:hypothetical protein [Rickettsiella endosymbiont of Litargus connexus]|jgi:hypothetical protein|uniref:hypothetical protein n=1 Tax=Rickettsiella endosymbiont of Litargus connexus TaxID=3066237 RepID=UPI00376ED992|nr:hypothetical protein [Gammaproteobacteria bacterium]MCH9755416.1 hypothetical protein [Gammaproteobacteria bacterium]MDD4892775.1 hypothetical protein [Candidatus Rickettsiella isopodorum]MDD5161902.1 hypothetical protein [Candidatus Rickettsiella isopodorum]